MKPDPEKGKIDRPYKLKVSEYKLIRDSPPIESKEWSHSRFKSLKENIKNHYSVVQNDYCAFCRTKINFKGYNEPIEHVVNKDSKIDWMFKPLNLVLACDECNTRKGVKATLRKPYRALDHLPQASQYYRIVHPHFDNYEDYIVIEDNLFYKALDRDKGYFTIIICGLWHFQLLMKRAHLIKIDQMDLYKALTHRLSDITIHKLEKRRIKELINDVVNRRDI